MLNHNTHLTISRQSCENYIPFTSEDSLIEYVKMAIKLNFSLLTVDNFSIQDRDFFIKNTDYGKKHTILSPSTIFDIKDVVSIDDKLLLDFKHDILKRENCILLISRKTLFSNSLEILKEQLGKSRKNYEYICVKSEDKNVLKWAAHDRRVDFLSFSIAENLVLDPALCSVIKQNNKFIEIVLKPLLVHDNEKNLTAVLRNGKKLLTYILSTKTPFILTINPDSIFHLRTGIQQRYLGEFLGIPFNKSNKTTFDNQLLVLLRNLAKLQNNFIFNGVMEAL